MPKSKREVEKPKKGKPEQITAKRATPKGVKAKLKVTPTPTSKTETKAPRNPLLDLIGEYVRYYREGWRVGTLVEVTKTHTRIRPIGGKGSKEKDCIKILFDDIKRLDE
jgi:hypothetical protein